MRISTSTGEFEITETLLKAWKANFAAIDVELELARMHLWLLKNTARRPKNAIRFIEAWFKKCKPKVPKMHLVGGKMSEHEMLELGRKHGMEPRPGESWESFARRLKAVA